MPPDPGRRRTCEVLGCRRPARKGPWCWAHAKRRQRHQPLDAPLRPRASSPGAELAGLLLRAAAIAFADASGDTDESRMVAELERAACLYAAAVDKADCPPVVCEPGSG